LRLRFKDRQQYHRKSDHVSTFFVQTDRWPVWMAAHVLLHPTETYGCVVVRLIGF
jgi:hypothetical protein